MPSLEGQVGAVRGAAGQHHQDQPYKDMHVPHERLDHMRRGMRTATHSQLARGHPLKVLI